MEIVGSVQADQVPEGERRIRQPSAWAHLAQQCVVDHAQGKVTIIRVKNRDEVKKVRNNIMLPLRKLGFRTSPVLVPQGDSINMYLELAKYEPRGPRDGDSRNGQKPT